MAQPLTDKLTEEMPRGWRRQGRDIEKSGDELVHRIETGQWGSARIYPFKKNDIPLGYYVGGALVGYRDDRHLITFAGSRAGKGVSLIVPTMLNYGGSVLAIDPKGELATITAARRGTGSDYTDGMGGRVYVLDPFGRAEGSALDYRAAFNPLASIDHETDAGLARATMIADGLVIQEQGSGAHFTAAARSFIRGLILYVCATETGASRSLIRVRELIAQPLAGFEAMLSHMVELGGTIGRAASSMRLKSENERTSVISTADVQTDFLEDGAMRDVLSGHDFDLESLKTDETPATVYLCLPAGRLGTHGRWLRLMVALALEAMEETGTLKEGQPPVLFVLDEFAALGHMASIEKAAGQIAGFGVKLWPILQDVTQLKRDYKDSWETFIGNAGMVTAFGVSDVSTTEYLSKMLGKTLVKTYSRSDSSSTAGSGGTTSGNSASYQAVDLLGAVEIARHFGRNSGRLLCIPQGLLPFITMRLAYYRDFVGYFDPAPGYPAPPSKTEKRAAVEMAERAETERQEAAELERQREDDRKRAQREAAAKAATDAAKVVGKGVRDLAGFARRKLDETRKKDD